MVVAAAEPDYTRWDNMNATTNVSSIGSGTGSAVEVDFIYQGTASVSRKVGASNNKGFYTTTGATRDMTAAATRVVLFKVLATNSSSLDPLDEVNGMQLRVGSGTAAYNRYDVHGNDTYPIKGGWLIIPIDPNVTDYRTNNTGSPTLTACDYFGISCSFSNASKSENVAMDAVDGVRGYTIVGGTGADDPGTWQVFIDRDEGTVGARQGMVTTNEGIIQVFGMIQIGRDETQTVTATEFNDTDKTIVFPDGRFDEGFSGIELYLSNASTDVTFTRNVFIGRGSKARIEFDSTADVDATDDEVDIDPNVFPLAFPLVYSTEGGTSAIGPSDGFTVWTRNGSGGFPQLYAAAFNAMASLSNYALTSSGNEIHSLTRKYDTRPVFTATGTSGTALIDSCTFNQFEGITLTSVCTIQNTLFINCNKITQSSATIDGCTVATSSTLPGVAFIESNSLADIKNCTFNANAAPYYGHAIELTSTGSMNLDNNKFNGYGQNGTSFNTETDVTGGATDTISITAHGWTDGEPIIYNKSGGTEAIGLTEDTTTYWVNAIDANTVALYLNKGDAINDSGRISLTPSGAGNGESHILYSGNAAIVNDSGGAVTINVINGADVPTIRNAGASTTTVNAAVSVKLTVLDSADNSALQDARVRIEADTGGDLPSDASVTITRSGSTATVSHTSHGLATSDVVYIRGADQDEYNIAATITVSDANTYTYTVSGTPTTPATGTITSTAQILAALTNASGVAENASFNFTSNQPIRGTVRKATTPGARFKASSVGGTITSSGFDGTILLISDE